MTELRARPHNNVEPQLSSWSSLLKHAPVIGVALIAGLSIYDYSQLSAHPPSSEPTLSQTETELASKQISAEPLEIPPPLILPTPVPKPLILDTTIRPVEAREIPASPRLDGTFIYAQSLSQDTLPQYLDELNKLDIKFVIQTYSKEKLGSCTSNNYQWVEDFPETIGFLLDEAEKRGMSVYLGIDGTAGACPMGFMINPSADQTVADVGQTLSVLTKNYSQHKALAGWYLSDEANLADVKNWTEGTYQYYMKMTNKIRQSSNLPILATTYLNKVAGMSPELIADTFKAFIDKTGVDVLVVQDSVGAEGHSPERIRAIYRALSETIGKQHLWSDVELFGGRTAEGITGGAYRPATWQRIAWQLAETQPFVNSHVAWLLQHHASQVSPDRLPEAARLLDEMKAAYGLDGLTFLEPASYDWLSPTPVEPEGKNTQLFDKKTGDLLHPQKNWVLVPGTADIIINFGKEQHLRWLSGQFLHQQDSGLSFPSELQLSCSTDGETWSLVGTWGLPIQPADSEYTFSNPEPLDVRCQFAQATFLNPTGITAIGEVTAVGSP